MHTYLYNLVKNLCFYMWHEYACTWPNNNKILSSHINTKIHIITLCADRNIEYTGIDAITTGNAVII